MIDLNAIGKFGYVVVMIAVTYRLLSSHFADFVQWSWYLPTNMCSWVFDEGTSAILLPLT